MPAMTVVVSAAPPPALPGEPRWAANLASRPDRKNAVVEALVGVMTERGLVVSDDLPWLRLCLEEVLQNAMYHGNQGDPVFSVSLVLHHDDPPTRWWLRVDDDGQGFSPSDIPSLDDDLALRREHGRGILLMRDWLDLLSYWHGGRTALLERRVPGRCGPDQATGGTSRR